MFIIHVESRFSATHHIRLHDGSVEPSHGHDWNVRATFARTDLDELGMVVDFADALRILESALKPLSDQDLNVHPAFRELNPTTEVVARWIYNRMLESGAKHLAEVEVTEAPGCRAVYRPDEPSGKLLRNGPN